MKQVFLIYEADQHGKNRNLIGCFTARSRAIKEVINQIISKEGEISESTLEFLDKNLQTQGLEAKYFINEQETNVIL